MNATRIAVLIGLIGMIVVINPSSFLNTPKYDINWIIGVFYGLLSALFFSLYQIGTRILAPKESTITSLIFAGSAGIIITSILNNKDSY